MGHKYRIITAALLLNLSWGIGNCSAEPDRNSVGQFCFADTSCPEGLECVSSLGLRVCSLQCEQSSAMCGENNVCVKASLDSPNAYCLPDCSIKLCSQGLRCIVTPNQKQACWPLAGTTGSPCADKRDCHESQYCELQLADGMCTNDCSPCPESCLLKEEPCPENCVMPDEPLCPYGGRCTVIQIPTYNKLVYRCVSECEDHADCRAQYSCEPIPEGQIAVCMPD